MNLTVDEMEPADWAAVQAIYHEGIETGLATFETAVPTWDSWNANHLTSHRFVARSEGQVIGWAALSPVSSRCVYEGVSEVSIYIAAAARGQGVGKALLQTLVSSSEKDNIWTLQAGLFPENEASLALHQACGFRIVGHRERIGQLHGRWHDTLLLERRSTIVE